MIASPGWSLLGLLLLAQPAGARADALRRVDDASSSGGSDRSSSGQHGWSSSGSSGSDSSSQSDCSDDECDDAGVLFAILLLAPWWLPYAADEPGLSAGYAPYPFADGPGLLRRSDPTDPQAAKPRRVLLQLDAESGFLLQGVVPGSLAARLQLPHRMELDARVSLLSDVYETPSRLGVSGTGHVTLRHGQRQRVDFRTGLGVRVFALDQVQLGFDLLYAIDGYIAKNLVLRIELHVGNLGDTAVGQARSSLGVMIKRSELYAGWDQTGLAGPDSTSRLGGPIAGIRTWF